MSGQKVTRVIEHAIDDVGVLLIQRLGFRHNLGFPVIGELLIGWKSANLLFTETCFDFPETRIKFATLGAIKT